MTTQLNAAYASSIHKPYSLLLNKYVESGSVNYDGLKQERIILDEYLNSLSKITKNQFESWSKPDQLAFLINIYNATTLQLTINNKPIVSLKNTETIFLSPWKMKVVRIFNNVTSLETLEYKLITRQYHEPRVHLALVRSTISCPPLRSEAYEGNALHEQLDEQGKLYFTSPQGILIDHHNKKISLSKVFKWHKKDFFSIPHFVNKYNNVNFDNYNVSWIEYDWTLNASQ